MSKLIIQLQGGLIQDVFNMGTGTIKKVIVVDHDINDAPMNITVTGKDGDTFTAAVHSMPINKLPKDCDVERLVKAYLSL